MADKPAASNPFFIPSYTRATNMDSQLLGPYTEAMNDAMRKYLKELNTPQRLPTEEWSKEFTLISASVSHTNGKPETVLKQNCEEGKPILSRDNEGKPILVIKDSNNQISVKKPGSFQFDKLPMAEAGANGMCDDLVQKVVMPKGEMLQKLRERD